MRTLRRAIFAFVLVFVGSTGQAAAQFDPRPVLGALISAFQNCGPPQVYQMLSPQLFQLVAAQTGGMGCYQDIRAAGPVYDMQILQQQAFPIGPLYIVRVGHQSVAADWFIGFNQFTQRVEYLNFQQAQVGVPPPDLGDPRPIDVEGPSPPPPLGGGDGSDGCSLYPAMCAR